MSLAATAAAASSPPKSRAALLQAAVAAEKSNFAKRKAVTSLPASQKDHASYRSDGRADRRSEDSVAKRTRILSSEYISAAFCGQRLVAAPNGTKCLPHPNPCLHPLPVAAQGMEQLPCYHNVWAGGYSELSQHLAKLMTMSSEVRTQWVFERMRNEFYADPGADGESRGKPRWHFRVNGREVCKRTFAAVHGVGESTLEGLQPRVKSDKRFAHPKHEEGSGKTKAARVDWKAITVIAWMLAYADEMGDLMPDE
jgi:hypothetical protein